MLIGRRGRPMSPINRYQNPNQLRSSQIGTTQNLFSHFQTSDGKLDFDKLSKTAQQIRSVYSQVSPMINKFIKK